MVLSRVVNGSADHDVMVLSFDRFCVFVHVVDISGYRLSVKIFNVLDKFRGEDVQAAVEEDGYLKGVSPGGASISHIDIVASGRGRHVDSKGSVSKKLQKGWKSSQLSLAGVWVRDISEVRS